MRLLVSCVLLVGCVESSSHETTAPPMPDASEQAAPVEPCPAVTSLYGMGPATPTMIASRTYDTVGVDYCLALDARDNLRIAHFGADTDYENGATSSFQLTLLAADGSTLRDGWDVQVGETDTRTFANLEYSIEQRVVVSARLRVRAKAGTATGAISLSLFEPYE